MAVVRKRVSKDFELTGPVTFARAGVSEKTRQAYFILSVAGISFFLPDEFHEEARFLEDGQIITIKGEYAGDQVRNGQRSPNLEVYEILPGGIEALPPTVHNGNGVKVDKGQPA